MNRVKKNEATGLYENLYEALEKKNFKPGERITQSEESVVFFKQNQGGKILSLQEDAELIETLRAKDVYRVEQVDPTKDLDTYYLDEDGDLLAFESKFMRLATEEEISYEKIRTMFKG